MRLLFTTVCLFCLWSCSGSEPPAWALVIHGGAGTIHASTLNEDQQAVYHAQLDTALQTGQDILEDGGSALDAVTAAIQVLEDSPLFNAGRGAVFTHAGRNELDASIMDGRDLNATAALVIGLPALFANAALVYQRRAGSDLLRIARL
ncbi:MAG: isoaspartyl peptidase/L-asparaginase, partial [Gammaproteobacteria bacterium]|nr:isoaspartyl peptidase/L-asparaginase [Gammaproteobacteria bacterium]